MKAFFAAIKFLTVLPVGKAGGEFADMGRSVKFFPLVGLLLGVIAAGLAWCWVYLFGAMISAVLIVVSFIVLTGGLHLDGLADTADGLLSVRGRERMLEIMKDSRSGAMAVIVIVCLLMMKAAAIASVPMGMLLRTVLLIPVAGRCAMMVGLSILPYARSEEELGSMFVGGKRKVDLVVGIAGAVLVGWVVLGMAGVIASVASLVGALVFSLYCRKKIGGFTGDTLGATCELAEVIVPLAIVAWSIRI